MTVFKTIFRVMRNHTSEIIIPFIIFIIFALISGFNANQKYEEFTRTKPVVSIVNNDSEIGEGLLAYLEPRVTFKELSVDRFNEAVFYQQVALTVEIPQNYTEGFLSQGTPLASEMLTDGAHGYIAQEMINTYLRTYKALSDTGLSHQEIQKQIMASGTPENTINFIETETIETMSIFENFSNLSLYPFFISVTGVLVTILMIFDKKEVLDRTVVSSVSLVQRNALLFSGIIIIGHAFFVLIASIGYAIMKVKINPETYIYSLLNLYIMLWVAMSAAFLISKLINSKSAQAAVINSVGLGLSFVSGVFVPAYLLSPSIVTFSKLFPFYWNVEANRIIGSGEITLKSLGFPFLIQLLFAAAMVLIALNVARRKTINK